MSDLSFSSANLAVIAYAQVNANGHSPNENSGVTTTRISMGLYGVIFPPNQEVTPGDFIMHVQARTNDTPFGKNTVVGLGSAIGGFTDVLKIVEFWTTQIIDGVHFPLRCDSDFCVWFLRTTSNQPPGAPA